MRRRLLLVFVGVAAGAGLALPIEASGQGIDSVTADPPGQLAPLSFAPGCGPCTRGGIRELDVQSGPSGENPTGTVSIHFGGGSAPTYTGPVTCLAVSGNQAVIGYSGVTTDSNGAPRAFAAAVHLTDIAGAGSIQDTLVFQEVTPPGPADCSPLPPPGSETWYTDIIVHDAPALPTSKNQCKNGGWRNYGTTFKNQGDCVSFVEHQARQECIFIRAYDRPAFRARYGTPLTGQHAMRRCVRQRSDD
jgi:hypothetical protein